MKSSATPQAAAGTGFGARLALVLIVLIWSAQLSSLVGLLSGNAQAQIAIHFQTTQIAWFSLSAALVGTFATPFVVKAADIYGKRRMMIVISAAGLGGDLIAALAPNFATLLIGKGISGLYLPMAALVYAIARDIFPRKLVGPASGLIGGGIGLVALGGPFLSGYLLDHHGFRGVLWFLAIGTAVSLAALVVFVPESPIRNESRTFDWAGGILLGAGLTAIVFGVGKGSEWGWTAASTLACVLGGLAALVAFVVVEGRVAEPMFQLELLARREVWTVLVATGILAGTVFAAGTVTQLLALLPTIPGVSAGLGFTATRMAVIGAPASVLIIIAAVTAGALARKVDTRILLAVGAVFTAVGYFLFAEYHYTAGQLLVVGTIGGIGTGIVAAVAPIMIIEAVRPHEQALANGMQNMAQGIVTNVVTQVLFVVMALDGTVLQGTQFYPDSGFADAYRVVAGMAVAGLLLLALVPRLLKLDQAEVGAVLDHAAEPLDQAKENPPAGAPAGRAEE